MCGEKGRLPAPGRSEKELFQYRSWSLSSASLLATPTQRTFGSLFRGEAPHPLQRQGKRRCHDARQTSGNYFKKFVVRITDKAERQMELRLSHPFRPWDRASKGADSHLNFFRKVDGNEQTMHKSPLAAPFPEQPFSARQQLFAGTPLYKVPQAFCNNLGIPLTRKFLQMGDHLLSSRSLQ